MTRRGDTLSLRESLEQAIGRSAARDASVVLPLLHRLARRAKCGSEEFVFAHRKLAELLSERAPWRASLHARRVLACAPHDAGAWATLALCQTLLGNYRYARAAYVEALAASPDNAWYAHNLGHLLDVALGDPASALLHLARAHAVTPWHPDVCASYAHALARVGRLADARRVLVAVDRVPRPREIALLLEWVDAGAPDAVLAKPRATVAIEPGVARAMGPRQRLAFARELGSRLSLGVAHLPFAASQRQRVAELADDALGTARRPDSRIWALPPDVLAAALAYSVVYVDAIPLSVGEVAGPFRVGIADLRGAFARLRRELDLTPGDVRYCSPRAP